VPELLGHAAVEGPYQTTRGGGGRCGCDGRSRDLRCWRQRGRDAVCRRRGRHHDDVRRCPSHQMLARTLGRGRDGEGAGVGRPSRPVARNEAEGDPGGGEHRDQRRGQDERGHPGRGELARAPRPPTSRWRLGRSGRGLGPAVGRWGSQPVAARRFAHPGRRTPRAASPRPAGATNPRTVRGMGRIVRPTVGRDLRSGPTNPTFGPNGSC